MADNDGMQKMLPEADAFKRKYARHPLCARTSYSCNKLFLFIYTLLFLFVGIILVAIGVLVELHRQQVADLNNQLSLPVALLIVVGLVIAANALCGMVGTLNENIILLKVFLIITVISFLVQVTIGVIAFVYREQTAIRVASVLSTELMFAVEGYKENEGLARAMDYLQNRYECCGLRSYRDYSEMNEEYFCRHGKLCGVPASCCRSQEGIKLSETCGHDIIGNLTAQKYIYTNGCTHFFMHWLLEHLDLTGAIALGFAIPQIIGILLVYFFIRRVGQYQKGYRVGQYFG